MTKKRLRIDILIDAHVWLGRQARALGGLSARLASCGDYFGQMVLTRSRRRLFSRPDPTVLRMCWAVAINEVGGFGLLDR
jgi:hypothetical protein